MYNDWFFLFNSRPFRPIAASVFFSLYSFLSSTISSPFVTPNILRPSLTRSSHRCLGLPLSRLLFGFHFVMISVSWFSALQTCPAQLILWLLNISTTLGSLNKLFNNLFDLISSSPSSFIFGPNILCRIFLSKIVNLFSSD